MYIMARSYQNIMVKEMFLKKASLYYYYYNNNICLSA